jgi:hypothetical protein
MTEITITTTQICSRRAMGYLWDRRKDFEIAQAKLLNAIYDNRDKKSIQIEQKITYKLSNKAAGKLGFGRLYGSKGGFEQLQREIRGTLCKDYYYDIDIKNCHPCLLPQLAIKKLQMNLPEIELWNRDRETNLMKIDPCREIAKTELCRVFFGGKPTLPFLLPLFEEVQRVAKALSTLDEYTDLYAAVKKSKLEDGQVNVVGAFLHYVLATEERKVMLVMKDVAEKAGWCVDVLAYDGIQVRKEDKHITSSFLETIQDTIKLQTGYSVIVCEKPFEFFDMPDLKEQVVDGVSREQYNEMKERFEESHFYFVPNNSVAEVKDGVITFYDKEHSNNYFRHDANWVFKRSERFGDHYPFFAVWSQDVHRRTIHAIDFKPSDDPNTFVLPLSFAFQKIFADSDQAVIDAFLWLVAVNTGRRQLETDYVLNYLSHLLQKPFDLPRKALLFIGLQGSGKDMLWDFIGSKILGSTYYENYQRNEQFFAGHDVGRENKFLVKLEEADPRFCRQHASDIKSLITAPTHKFNPKGKKEYSRENYMRLVLTTNKANPLELEQSDRRWIIFTNTNELINNEEQKQHLLKTLINSKTSARIIADWLLVRNIRDFDPFTAAPVTEMKQNMLEAEMTSEERFLEQWNGERTTAGEIYTQYRAFCMEHEYPYAQNLQSFGKRMLIHIASGKLVKTASKGMAYYKKP